MADEESIFLHKESVFLHGIFNDITEQDTSPLDCKHKHMMKSRAPPDNVFLHRLLPREFHAFTSRIDFKELSLFGSWSYLNLFRDGIGPFKFLCSNIRAPNYTMPVNIQ